MTTPTVTVPVEPTEEMMKAADAVDWTNEDERASVINMWQVMLSAAPAPEGGAVRRGVYAASRASAPERPAMWRKLRDQGYPIISTWIDEAGEGESRDLGDLWERNLREVTSAERLVLYVEAEDFPLKGAYVEVGMALAAGVPVFVVTPGVSLDARSLRPLGSWAKHPLVTFCDTVDQAFAALTTREEAPAEAGALLPCPFCGHAVTIRNGVNAYGHCKTDGCHANRAQIVPLDDEKQVAAWNLRAQPQARSRTPVRLEIPLSNHMRVTLEYDPDGSRTAMLWNEANEPIADGEAPVLPAQPQAREDAQPVAWRGRISETSSVWDYRNFDMTGEIWSVVQPLYNHPAPDALRAALQEARNAVEFFDRVKAAPQAEQIAVGRDHWARMEAALRRLAALQAEQNGGA